MNRSLGLMLVFIWTHAAFAQSLVSKPFDRADFDGRLSTRKVTRPQRPKHPAVDAESGKRTQPPPRVSFAREESLRPGDYVRMVQVGGITRRYLVHIPPKYDATIPTPAVIAFHGGGGNPESMVRLSGLNEKSDRAGFILVYPYGSGPNPDRSLSFNGGECCGYAMVQKVDDVAFTRALLDDLATVSNLDADRVFATGLSNGGIMSHFLASELSDRIAAIAPVGGPLMIEAPNAKRPISVMHFHGTADEFAPFNGGFGRGATGGQGVTNFRSVEHTIQAWVRANGCRPEPTVEALPNIAEDGMSVKRKTWGGGRDGSEVILIEIEGGGHTWPGMDPIVPNLGKSTKDISANDLMWEFFQKHPRPSSTGGDTPPGEGTGMKFLRTPEARFTNLPGFAFTPHYLWVDDYKGGKLRMHYVDEGPKDAPTLLMLHGNPTWSYMFRDLVEPLNAAGYRTILLDYIGMGRSDKPVNFDDYTYDRHLGWLKQAFEQLDRTLNLGKVTIFGHDYGVPLGIRLMNEFYPERFDGFINANASLPVGDRISPTHLRWRQFVRDNPDVPVGNVVSSRIDPPLTREEIAAYNAPYPDASYKMAIRSFPEMVPDSPTRPEAVANIAAWSYLEKFSKPFMTIFGKFDALDMPSARGEFITRVPGAYGQPHAQLEVTHYAPEDKPEAVAKEVIQFLNDLYHPTPFATVQYAAFNEDVDGFSVAGGPHGEYDATHKAIKLTGDFGDASSARQTNSMDLTRCEVLKVGLRYRSFGIKSGEGFVVELWDGTSWVSLLKHVADADFRNGAEDYGFVRVDARQVTFSSNAGIRVRTNSSDAAAGLFLLDIGIYTRAKK